MQIEIFNVVFSFCSLIGVTVKELRNSIADCLEKESAKNIYSGKSYANFSVFLVP